jgi:RimJ/RimL family protein N-acetyltransferase
MQQILNLQPLLTGKQVLLRPLKSDDFEEIYSVASDPLIWEQHPVKTRYQREVYTTLFQELLSSQGTLVVIDRNTNEIIGHSRYYDYLPNDSNVAIGFTMLARKFWGGAYNRELKCLMLNHAFQKLDHVIFHVGEGNIRSRKSLEKFGARQFDQSIKIYQDGSQHVSIHYKIQKSDWLNYEKNSPA